MDVKWTREQKKVIDLRDRDILVSAAAGSGKTAVWLFVVFISSTISLPPILQPVRSVADASSIHIRCV